MVFVLDSRCRYAITSASFYFRSGATPLHQLRFIFEAEPRHFIRFVLFSKRSYAITSASFYFRSTPNNISSHPSPTQPNKKRLGSFKIQVFSHHINIIRICSNRQRDHVRMILHARQRLQKG